MRFQPSPNILLLLLQQNNILETQTNKQVDNKQVNKQHHLLVVTPAVHLLHGLRESSVVLLFSTKLLLAVLQSGLSHS